MRLYDTRTRRVEPIVSAKPGQLSIYACGPTVYRDAHVGNMRTFLLPDLIARLGTLQGLQVQVVQNITDVGHMADDTGLGAVDEGQGDTEDKVLAQAAGEGTGALAVARRYEQRFHDDLARLNIYPAAHYPRASDCIDLMIELITSLLASGHAYIGGDGSVFFDARSVSDYGAISGNRLDHLRPGHRFDGDVDPAKRFHADWALWKVSGPSRTQLVWDTPWGKGYPGWHTECSAMSLALLGDVIDIHTGGIDLRFPHHEDERAQSNAMAGHDVVRHWVHAEHLLFEGRKMSKSAGNVVLVQDVVDAGLDPLSLRLAFMQHRYRQQMNLTWDVLTAADATLQRWRAAMAQWATSPSQPIHHPTLTQVMELLDDDLDTARSILVLREFERDHGVQDGAKFETFASLDRFFGLDLARQVGQVSTLALPAEAVDLLAQRRQARADKQWAASDVFRDQLAAIGVIVTDTAHGQEVNGQPVDH